MVADGTAGDSAEDRVMAGEMSCDAADRSTLQAARRLASPNDRSRPQAAPIPIPNVHPFLLEIKCPCIDNREARGVQFQPRAAARVTDRPCRSKATPASFVALQRRPALSAP